MELERKKRIIKNAKSKLLTKKQMSEQIGVTQLTLQNAFKMEATISDGTFLKIEDWINQGEEIS